MGALPAPNFICREYLYLVPANMTWVAWMTNIKLDGGREGTNKAEAPVGGGVSGMTVTVNLVAGQPRRRDVFLPGGATYFDLLASLEVNPETVVVFRDGVPVALDSVAGPGRIDVVRVVSGG